MLHLRCYVTQSASCVTHPHEALTTLLANESGTAPHPGRPQGIAPTMDERACEADAWRKRGDPWWSRSLGCAPDFHQNGHSPAESLTGSFVAETERRGASGRGTRATQGYPATHPPLKRRWARSSGPYGCRESFVHEHHRVPTPAAIRHQPLVRWRVKGV